MINYFKSKAELEREAKEELLQYVNKRITNQFQRDRFIRVEVNNTVEGDDILYFSNCLVKYKFNLRNNYNLIHRYYNVIKKYKSILEIKWLTDDKKQEIDATIEKCRKSIKDLNEVNINIGEIINNYLAESITKHFSDHEIRQLIGGSHEQCERIRKYIDKKETGTSNRFVSYIMHHGEYRCKKGRSKDFIDCSDSEMPLFHAMEEYMMY